MKALGLELLAPGSPSDAVTAVKVPSNVDGGAITKTLRDKYGVTIAGGQSQLKGKIFRISHMGYVSKADILLIVGMTEVALKELGYDLEPGRGVSRAQEILFQE
jgi:aspartate aminotransferase-like enzyme